MSQSAFNSGRGSLQPLNVRAYRLPPQRSTKPSRQELEQRLAVLQKEYAELHTEIFEATQVHRRLCAPRLVRQGNFEIASEIFAVRHLPGDFFTVAETNSGVVLALGDICGKGLAAGMWTTHLVGLTGARMAVTSEPAAVAAGVNRDICLMKSIVPLASLFLARLDPATGMVKYCSAGHPPAFLLRASGELELLSEGGPLLGVVPAAAYVNGSFKLSQGDVLMIYSDGINESMNAAGEEFGYERLEAQLRRSRTDPAGAVLFSALGAVQDFAAACPLVDDMTLVIVRQTDQLGLDSQA
jgi:serine phosphatase RsbU (regulator of sigma subunit)